MYENPVYLLLEDVYPSCEKGIDVTYCAGTPDFHFYWGDFGYKDFQTWDPNPDQFTIGNIEYTCSYCGYTACVGVNKYGDWNL